MPREVVDLELGNALQGCIVPHILESVGEAQWAGSDIDQQTAEVLEKLLNLDTEADNLLRE